MHNETDIKDFLNAIENTDLREWARCLIISGSTLHSVQSQMEAETKKMRGWLIGRFG